MMLLKKTYAQQLLQLALALSLLRVNQDNYFNAGSWQLAGLGNTGDDGMQLEMQTVPSPHYDDYPYANRKAVMPIIEDLIHFNRYRHTNTIDIQTYLLNVQNDTAAAAAATASATIVNDTAAELTFGGGGGGGAADELDLFLNSEQFDNVPSVVELNLADLRDFDDRSFPYAGLPLKDEIYAATIDLPSTSFSSGIESSSPLSSAGSSFDDPDYTRVINWAEFYDNSPEATTLPLPKREPLSDDEHCEETDECVHPKDAMLMVEFKKEIKSEDEEEQNSSSSGFSSSVELTQEVSYFFFVAYIFIFILHTCGSFFDASKLLLHTASLPIV